jgi:hypothetical protein
VATRGASLLSTGVLLVETDYRLANSHTYPQWGMAGDN